MFCDTCVHWRKFFDGGKNQLGIGVCKCNPPTARDYISNYVPDGKNLSHAIYYNEGIWPSTSSDDSCDCHEEADDYEGD